MEEEGTVITSWKRSDFDVGRIESVEPDKVVHDDSLGKENADLKARRLEKDGRNTEFSKEFGIDESEDEVTLDDDTLSRLIEGDTREKSHFGHGDSNSLTITRPKPKPRHKEKSVERQNNDSVTNLFSGNKENSPNNQRKNSTDKLSSGNKDGSPDRERKNSAAKLFSGKKENSPERSRRNSADKLFSGNKDKSPEHNKTSPRPVPRLRSKQFSKEGPAETQGNGHRKADSFSNSDKADKIFDSTGKGNRTVSFEDFKETKDVSSKSGRKFSEKDSKGHSSDFEKSNTKLKQSSGTAGDRQKVPPTKPTRTKVKPGLSKEQIDDSPEHRQPKPRHPRQPFEKQNMVDSDHQGNYEQSIESRNRINEGRQDMNGYVGPNSEDPGFSLHNKPPNTRQMERGNGFMERRDIRQDDIRGDVYGNVPKGYEGQEMEYERSDWMMNGQDSARNYHERRGHAKDGRDMFEEHVPHTEGVLQHKYDYNNHERRVEGTGRFQRNTPLKAEKGLEEMTKSPELYNFQYESRDVPHRPPQSPRGKDDYGMKRSSSLNNLNNSSRSVQFEEDEQDEVGWESSRSGLPSSKNIRETVYNEWLQSKQHGLKEKVKKKVEDKKKDEEKEKEKLEKQMSGKKAFEVWNSRKGELLVEQVKKKKVLENKKIDEKREKVGKQKDAKKFFESWKSKKDELLKESFMEKKAKKMEVKQKEKEDIEEKGVIAKKSYDKWKQRKDGQIKEEIKSKRNGELLKTKYEIEGEMEKRHESEKAFQEFLRKKGTTKRRPPSPSLTQRAWCPGGLTKGTNLIPGKVQPVLTMGKLNRSRSFSGSTTMTSFHKRGGSSKGW